MASHSPPKLLLQLPSSQLLLLLLQVQITPYLTTRGITDPAQKNTIDPRSLLCALKYAPKPQSLEAEDLHKTLIDSPTVASQNHHRLSLGISDCL